MTSIGIDPGLGGALAVIREDGSVAVWDAPVVLVGTKRKCQIGGMRQLIDGIIADPRCGALIVAAVELVHAFPKAGSVSRFTFGEGFGLWQGLLNGRDIPFDLVEPQAWKKVMLAGQGKAKQASVYRAQQIFPGLGNQLIASKHGRAEALLIAEYRRRQG